MSKYDPIQTPETNIHTHLFTADHVPEIQFYYQIRDIIATLLSIPLSYVDTIHKGRYWWLMNLARIGLFFYRSYKRNMVKGLINLFETVSNLKKVDLERIIGKTSYALSIYDVLCFIIKNIKEIKKTDDKSIARDPFNETLREFVRSVYEIHNQKLKANWITQEKVFESFINSLNNQATFKRIVALTMNFDDAFHHVYQPGSSQKRKLSVLPKKGFLFDQQANELLKLAQKNIGKGVKILPFLCIDPRRYNNDGTARRPGERNLIAELNHYVREDRFCGIKIYPPLGYLPEDVRLEPLYSHCMQKQIPIIVHGGTSGAGRKGAVNCSELAHPYYWIPVLDGLIEEYNDAKQNSKNVEDWKFKLCLAHFGGSGPMKKKKDDWWDEVISLMDQYKKHEKIVEIYTDVSFNIPIKKKMAKSYFRIIHTKLCRNKYRRNRVLFGDDWWMYLFQCDPITYYDYFFKRWRDKSFYQCLINKQQTSLSQLFDKNAKCFLGRFY